MFINIEEICEGFNTDLGLFIRKKKLFAVLTFRHLFLVCSCLFSHKFASF